MFLCLKFVATSDILLTHKHKITVTIFCYQPMKPIGHRRTKACFPLGGTIFVLTVFDTLAAQQHASLRSVCQINNVQLHNSRSLTLSLPLD